MKHIYILSLFFSLALVSCREEKIEKPYEDETFSTGGIATDQDVYAQIPECSLPNLVFKNGDLPFSFALNFPDAGNQGCLGSCASYAASYIMSYYAFNALNATAYSDNVLRSPAYLFNQAYTGNNCQSKTSGSKISTNDGKGVLDILKSKGICSRNEMPYQGGSKNIIGKCGLSNCNLLPTAIQHTQASPFKIRNFEKIEATMSNPYRIQELLIQGYPVMFQMPVRGNFASTQYFGYTGVLNQTSDIGDSIGPHAMVIVGFDDSKNAYRCINSWGNLWGENGYFWIDYDYFKIRASEKYVVYLYRTKLEITDCAVQWDVLNMGNCGGYSGSVNYLTLSYNKTTFNPNEEPYVLHCNSEFSTGETSSTSWTVGSSGFTQDIVNGTLKVRFCSVFSGASYIKHTFWITTNSGISSNYYTFYKYRPPGANKTDEVTSNVTHPF